jgi:glycosyltransferase involved in cell wall biosynthesis
VPYRFRVLHTGNLANNSYKLAKFQRSLDIDARLRLLSTQRGTSDDPSWEDRELARGYPDWIETVEVDPVAPRRKLKRGLDILFRRVPRESGIDILHAQCTAPIMGQFQAPGRLVSHCLGSDLRELAFSHGLNGHLMRRALRASRIVFFNNVDHAAYLDRLGIEGVFLPNPLDLDRYRPRPAGRMFPGRDFVVFHPVSHDWTYRGRKRSSTKGNDRLIRAFARLVRENRKALLVCIVSGPDVEASRALAGKLGIGDNVEFVDRQRKEALGEMLNAADLIADQFDLGALGGVAVEALACGRPLLTYLNDDAARRCYATPPPLFNARTENEIYAALQAARQADLNVAGAAARAWAQRHHDWRIVVEGVTRRYETAFA